MLKEWWNNNAEDILLTLVVVWIIITFVSSGVALYDRFVPKYDDSPENVLILNKNDANGKPVEIGRIYRKENKFKGDSAECFSMLKDELLKANAEKQNLQNQINGLRSQLGGGK